MILRKQFISDTIRGATNGNAAQTVNPTGGATNGTGSLDLPPAPAGGIGTGAGLAGNPALLIINLGASPSDIDFWPGQQTASPQRGGACQMTIPAGQSRIIAEMQASAPISYTNGPLRLVSGAVNYVVDLNPNDPSAVVAA